jgi:hypothetical protein
MNLGSKSRALLKEARTKVAGVQTELSAASASGKLTMNECWQLASDLRVAASKVEEIGGRLFYANARKSKA